MSVQTKEVRPFAIRKQSAPSLYRTPLHDLPDPETWFSDEAKMLWRLIHEYDVSVHSGKSVHRPGESVDIRVARAELEIVPPSLRLPRRISEEEAREAHEAYLTRLQGFIDRERLFARAYGPLEPVSQPWLPTPPRHYNEDRQRYLLCAISDLHQAGWVITSAGEQRVARGPRGDYHHGPH